MNGIKNYLLRCNKPRCFSIASIKHQIKNRQFKTAENECKLGEKARKTKVYQSHRATPKPWVAGSNPPAPAKQKKSIAIGGGLLLFDRDLKWEDSKGSGNK